MKRLRESSDPYYDLFDDFDLIVSSFQTQYGIRIYSRDFKEMKWDEFKALLCGLNADTPLGKIINIRAEDDPKVIKNFTSSQKKIRSDWRSKTANSVDKQSYDDAMEGLKNMFMSMAK